MHTSLHRIPIPSISSFLLFYFITFIHEHYQQLENDRLYSIQSFFFSWASFGSDGASSYDDDGAGAGAATLGGGPMSN